MKREWLVVAAALLVLVLASTRQGQAATAIGDGDVNCDGAVNSIDAAIILQIDAGLLGGRQCTGNTDMNGDGTVNSIDAAIILQIDAGVIERPPTPPPNPDLEITAVMGTDPTGVGNVLTFVITATNRGAPVCNLEAYVEYTLRIDANVVHGTSLPLTASRLETGETTSAWVLGNAGVRVLLSQKIIAVWEFC